MRSALALALAVAVLAAGCSGPGETVAPPAPTEAPPAPRYLVPAAPGAGPVRLAFEGTATRVTTEGLHVTLELGDRLTAETVAPINAPAGAPVGGGARIGLTHAHGSLIAPDGTRIAFSDEEVVLYGNYTFYLHLPEGATFRTAKRIEIPKDGAARLALRDFPPGPVPENVPLAIPTTTLNVSDGMRTGRIMVRLPSGTHEADAVEFLGCECGLLADTLTGTLRAASIDGVAYSTALAVSRKPIADLKLEGPGTALRIGNATLDASAAARVTEVSGAWNGTAWSLQATAVQVTSSGSKPQLEASLHVEPEGGPGAVTLSLSPGERKNVFLRVAEKTGAALASGVIPVLDGDNSTFRVSTTRVLTTGERGAARLPHFIHQPWPAPGMTRAFRGDPVDLGPGEAAFIGVAVEAPSTQGLAHEFVLLLRSANAAEARVTFQVRVTTG